MDAAPGPAARPRPRVLFVGDDQSSPEIAATLLRRLVGDRVEVGTAGAQPLEPGGRADDILVQMGLNPASEERLSARALTVADRVVVLGTGLDVARVAGRRYEEWDVANEDLAERVRRLAAELTAPPPPAPPTRGERLRRSAVRGLRLLLARVTGGGRVVVRRARSGRRRRRRGPGPGS